MCWSEGAYNLTGGEEMAQFEPILEENPQMFWLRFEEWLTLHYLATEANYLNSPALLNEETQKWRKLDFARAATVNRHLTRDGKMLTSDHARQSIWYWQMLSPEDMQS